MNCDTNIAYYYIGISFGGLSYGTLYKYSLIIHCDLISFPHTNLMLYLCIVLIKLLFVLYCYELFVLCLLLF
jgi:hypothetical protein